MLSEFESLSHTQIVLVSLNSVNVPLEPESQKIEQNILDLGKYSFSTRTMSGIYFPPIVYMPVIVNMFKNKYLIRTGYI